MNKKAIVWIVLAICSNHYTYGIDKETYKQRLLSTFEAKKNFPIKMPALPSVPPQSSKFVPKRVSTQKQTSKGIIIHIDSDTSEITQNNTMPQQIANMSSFLKEQITDLGITDISLPGVSSKGFQNLKPFWNKYAELLNASKSEEDIKKELVTLMQSDTYNFEQIYDVLTLANFFDLRLILHATQEIFLSKIKTSEDIKKALRIDVPRELGVVTENYVNEVIDTLMALLKGKGEKKLLYTSLDDDMKIANIGDNGDVVFTTVSNHIGWFNAKENKTFLYNIPYNHAKVKYCAVSIDKKIVCGSEFYHQLYIADLPIVSDRRWKVLELENPSFKSIDSMYFLNNKDVQIILLGFGSSYVQLIVNTDTERMEPKNIAVIEGNFLSRVTTRFTDPILKKLGFKTQLDMTSYNMGKNNKDYYQYQTINRITYQQCIKEIEDGCLYIHLINVIPESLKKIIQESNTRLLSYKEYICLLACTLMPWDQWYDIEYFCADSGISSYITDLVQKLAIPPSSIKEEPVLIQERDGSTRMSNDSSIYGKRIQQQLIKLEQKMKEVEGLKEKARQQQEKEQQEKQQKDFERLQQKKQGFWQNAKTYGLRAAIAASLSWLYGDR